MSMYGIINGPPKESSAFVLDCLKKEKLPEIPRYRDAYLKNIDDNLSFVIFTRTGGGNREEYEDANDAMTKHPLYISDRDDDFDQTYAEWYFRIPDKYQEEARKIFESQGGNPASLEEKTKNLVEVIKKGSPEENRAKFPDLARVIDAAKGEEK